MKYMKQHTLDDKSNDSFKKQHLFSLFQVSNPWLCLETNLKESDCVLMPMEPIFSIYKNNCKVNTIYCIIINEKVHERVSEHPA